MRIAMPYLPTSEDVGNQEHYVALLSAALGDLGHEVTAHSTPTAPKSSMKIDNEHLASGARRGKHTPRMQPSTPLSREQLPAMLQQFTQQLLTTWRADPPEVIHAHQWPAALATELAAQALGLPTVMTYIPPPAGPLEPSSVGRTIVRHADRLIALNTTHAKQLTLLGSPRSQITVIPCGVDVDRYHPTGPTAPRGPFTHRLICTAHGVPHDGTDTALEALSRTTDTELLIVSPSQTPTETTAHTRRIRRLAHQHGVGDRVQLCGAVDETDLPALLRSADLLVHLPHSDPLGSTALKAMACGIPVLATAVDALTDIVIDEHTGYLTATDNAHQCATLINQLLPQRFQRQALGAAGRTRTRSRYTWDRVAAETAQLYQQTTSDS